MKNLKRLLIVFVVFYLIALVFVYVKQRSFIYFPEKLPPPNDFAEALDVAPIDVAVGDLGNIRSYFKRPLDIAPIVLFFHGNGGSVYHREPVLRDIQSWGAGYMAVEYPGYAGNPGNPTEHSIYASALAHYDWLIANDVSPNQIVVYGHSLGAASAVHVAAERDAAYLVLSAPFISAKAMGQHRMPYFPTGILLKDQFRSDLKMPKVEENLLVLHGDLDGVIPHHMGEALTRKHTGAARFETIIGAGHSMWSIGVKDHLKAVVKDTAAKLQ